MNSGKPSAAPPRPATARPAPRRTRSRAPGPVPAARAAASRATNPAGSRCSGCPVVSSSSPPRSHGVGSSSSLVCTQRTGCVQPPAPACSVRSSPVSSPGCRRRSASVPSVPRWLAANDLAVAGACASPTQASSSTVSSTRGCSSRSSRVAISGGDSWITGSPRSSARQISPASYSRAGQEAAQQVLRLLVVERLLGLLVLDQLERVEVARRRGRRRRSASRPAGRAARGSTARCAARCRSRPRAPSRRGSPGATAQATGWPP